MAAFEEMRLARTLSLLQEFSLGWSSQAEGRRRRRKPLCVVAGYSADWKGDPLSLERKMAAFCREVNDPLKVIQKAISSKKDMISQWLLCITKNGNS